MESESRPAVAVSACLLGENVRYDGSHKLDAWITGSLSSYVSLISFCPEIRMGLGSPRPTLHLTAENPVRMLETATGRDVSSLAHQASAQIFAELRNARCVAVILKSRSPSCGIEVSTRANASERPGSSPGIFAETLLHASGMLLVEETALQTETARHDFVEAVFALERFRCMETGTAALQAFHRKNEYLLMARDSTLCARLGKVAANSARLPGVEVMQQYRKELLSLFEKNLRNQAA
ncbi:MAG: hypothetical protein A2X94_13740 [Bdellovibrionales bacterium GWB1_55_8]|nr:MAG: hypothetical protein A2X94_13740 [Bdellovibrionales bacterium GWB1_55_8]